MTAVYDVYVWRYEKLEWTVHDIVAQNERQAARRSVSALRSRPGQNTDLLLRLSLHLLGTGECPDGITLQVVKKVERPRGACLVSS